MSYTITVTNKRDHAGWVNGTIDVDGAPAYRFSAKVYDMPSNYGISTDMFPDGDNVSKLDLRDYNTDETIVMYDRNDWEPAPEDSPIGYAKAASMLTTLLEELEKNTEESGETAPWWT